MKNYLKTGLLVAATLAATSVFSHSLPPPRPLLAKSAKECNPSYLEAIKPTQIEIDSMFATAVELTVSYLKEDGSLKQTIAGSERDVKRMIVNKEFYENSILAPGVKLDVTRFNRHLLRSKLNWSDSHDESEIPSRIQG